ncbi:MAG: helix-turn-helix domain-containing protein, partial [Lachnospiraceae bacterium]|nr:helix-turn-helix domain-containing protein [Lachnospiraceae bacterium]
MVKFGEKLKQLREKSGMTQAALAQHLYVTRQAVSRWECGARYPDLLTTKKIAEILKVSIDELVSGEELQMNIEKEPVLAKPVSNIIQTMLYSIAAATYLLMSLISIKSLFPDKALLGTPAGKITLINIASVSRTFLCFLTVAVG